LIHAYITPKGVRNGNPFVRLSASPFEDQAKFTARMLKGLAAAAVSNLNRLWIVAARRKFPD
jgi:hypothetical protein